MQLEQGFLAGPQSGELHPWVVGPRYLFLLGLGEARLHQVEVQAAWYRLYVAAHGPVAHGACHAFAAMAQVEVYPRMACQERLPVLAIAKGRLVDDAIPLAQGPAKQEVGLGALHLVYGKAEGVGLFLSPNRQRSQVASQFRLIHRVMDFAQPDSQGVVS